MKKILLFAVILFSSVGCNNKSIHVSGTFSGAAKATVYLEKISDSGQPQIDSTVTNEKGDFKFAIKSTDRTPVFYNLINQNSVIPLILSPAEKVTVSSMGEITENYLVEGSPESLLLQEFNQNYNAGVKALDSLRNSYYNSLSNGVHTSTSEPLLLECARAYNSIKQDKMQFILAHPSSVVSIYAIYKNMPNDEAMVDSSHDYLYYKLLVDSIGTRYPESPYLMGLTKEMDRRRGALEFEKEFNAKAEVEMAFPEIELPDMLGNVRKLSDLKGKVILVYFWDHSNSTLVRLNADMKEIYNKQKDNGFEIYQIDLNSDKTSWVLSVGEQKLPWINVIDTRGGAGMAAMSYNVHQAPSNVLIDKNGKIAERDLFGDALIKGVEKLVKQ